MQLLEKILTKLYYTSGFSNFSWSHVGYYLAITIIMFIVELSFVGWQNSALKKIVAFNKSVRTDFYLWLLHLLNIYNLIAIILSFGTCYYLANLLQTRVDIHIGKLLNNFYLQFAITTILSDLVGYIKHRFFHQVKPFWNIHAFHHSATEMSLLTRYRVHFWELSIGRLFEAIPFVIMGLPIYSYFGFRVIVDIHQLLLHSNIKSNWGFVGNYILVSPAAHGIHHSKETKHFDSNYGITLIWWDRLFGTYYLPENVVAYGIPNNKFNKGLVKDVWQSIKGFGKSISNI